MEVVQTTSIQRLILPKSKNATLAPGQARVVLMDMGCNRMQSTPPFPQGKTAPKAQACRMSSHHLSSRVAPTRPVNPFWLEIQNVTKVTKSDMSVSQQSFITDPANLE